MNLISLFTGAGGLDLGFEKAGFNIIWANEFDPSIWKTYKRNFSKTVLDRRNITKVPSNEIPDAFGIIGGPPCQSFSLAGRREKDNHRNKLFLSFAEMTEILNPKLILFENVTGILRPFKSDDGKKYYSWIEVAKKFNSIGYKVYC